MFKTKLDDDSLDEEKDNQGDESRLAGEGDQASEESGSEGSDLDSAAEEISKSSLGEFA